MSNALYVSPTDPGRQPFEVWKGNHDGTVNQKDPEVIISTFNEETGNPHQIREEKGKDGNWSVTYTGTNGLPWEPPKAEPVVAIEKTPVATETIPGDQTPIAPVTSAATAATPDPKAADSK